MFLLEPILRLFAMPDCVVKYGAQSGDDQMNKHVSNTYLCSAWLLSFCASHRFFFVSATAQAEQRPTMTTHVPDAVSSGVAPLVGHLPGDQRLSLAISLPLRNEAELDELLQQLYDPQSPNYPPLSQRAGVHQTDLVPTESDYAAVLQFRPDQWT